MQFQEDDLVDTTNVKEQFKSQLIEKCKEKYLKFQNSDIVIWGTGIYGKVVFSLLDAAWLKKNVRAFL